MSGGACACGDGWAGTRVLGVTLTPVAVERVAPPRPFVCVRLGLIGLWLALLVGMVLVGERESSLAELRRGLASGSVDSIRVSGGLTDGARGAATQQVRWRSNGIERVATVREVSRPDGASHGSAYPVVREDVGTRLQSESPGLTVSREPEHWPGSTVWGFNGPGWFGGVALVATLMTLMLIVSGPPPWRATRWAWFWLMWTPVGALAFAVLSGPLGPLPTPRTGARGLTGGWAFLLAMLLTGVFQAG